jgi:hypothetical protein
VTDKFAPHDIVLAISTPDELSDAALGAACSLHTAGTSTSSSSTSSRPQKLSWIQEAAEEGGQGDSTGALRPPTATPTIPTILEPTPSIEEEPHRTFSVISDGAMSVPVILEEKVPDAKPTPAISHVTIETVTEAPTSPDADLADLSDTLRSYDKLFEGGPEPRSSTQTARPNYDELYEHYYSQYTKPKVKLGPRPRPSLEGKRPATSGSVPQSVSRPKSSLPAGLRSATRKAADRKAEESKEAASTSKPSVLQIPSRTAVPDAPSSPLSSIFTSRSPASVRSMPVSAYGGQRSLGMNQEKTRLMKALELRKKQMNAQVLRQEQMAEQATAKAEEDKAAYKEEADPAPANSSEVQIGPIADPDESPTMAKALEASESDQQTQPEETNSSLCLDASASALSSSQAETDDVHSSVSVSSPVSAQTQGSSGPPSTRPSSLAEEDTSMPYVVKMPEELEDVETPDFVDEEESVESLPTVVPEARTPVPSLTHPSSDDSSASLVDEPIQDRESVSLQAIQDGSPQRRCSKRESMLYIPTGEVSLLDETKFKRRNRESVIMPTSKRQSWYETKDKRRALLDPLQVSAENSEAEYLSDDSFMEELQSATVHEAKPMSVSKSPITPFFTRKPSENDVRNPNRGASQAFLSAVRPSPEYVPRKISGPWPLQASADTVVPAKKMNVSSGISQRIKALAEKSSRDSVVLNSPGSSLNTPSSSLAQRKSSFFATTPTETSPSGWPITRLGSPSFLSSTATTPEKKTPPRAQPTKSNVYNVQRGNEQPESVQVTARIVRDERTRMPALAMPTESTPLDLHQSPLIIDHQKPTFTPRSPTRGRPEPSSPKAPSTSHSRDPSAGPARESSESSWRPFGRRMSESKSIHSHDGEEKREEKKDKKGSRTSKMFKRMSSSMSSMPWKNPSNNLNPPEQDSRSTSLASLREPPPSVHVGDLNIQFPDTLLWKRRYVEIDGLGNLVLSPSRSNEKGVVKRFHLSEFRTPYPPDQDRQELPNSVVLDFIDGRTLQCACETYIAQAQVLQSKSLSPSRYTITNPSVQSSEKRTTPGLPTTKACRLPHSSLFPLRFFHFLSDIPEPCAAFFLQL